MPDKSGSPNRDRVSTMNADQHENRLLTQIATGDRRAFEQLFFAYHPRVLRFCLRMVKRQSIAEEIVNDVMLVVWNKADTFGGHSRVSTWIFGIAYRTSLKALRKQRTLNVFVQNQHVIDHASTDSDYGLMETQQWLRKGFDSLSTEQRAVVELSYFAGYGYAEIADIVKCPVNTVKTRMFHARRKLKQAMGDLAHVDPTPSVSHSSNLPRPKS